MPDATPPSLSIQDLPLWMRPRRQFDFGLLAALLIALNTLYPLLREGLPVWNDAALSAWRGVEAAQQLRAGIFYSRWAATFNFNYGSPIFNYIAPLPYYLTAYHQALTEADPVISFKLIMALALLAAGMFMYLFVRGRYGTPGALCAVTLYCLSPPLHAALPYVQGDLGGVLALGLLPMAAWRLDRLWIAPTTARIFLATLTVSLVMLADLQFAPIALVLLLLCAVTGGLPSTADPDTRPLMIGVFVGACALTAFFWLPAWGESTAVRYLPTNFDNRTGVISLNIMFSAALSTDYYVLNPVSARGVGIAALVVVLLAFPALSGRKGRGSARADGSGWFWIAGALCCLIAAVWPGAHHWLLPSPDHLAWAALSCFAVVAAVAGRWVLAWGNTTPNRVARAIAYALFVGLLIVPLATNLAALYPAVLPATTDLSTDKMRAAELPGYHAGTLRYGVLFPADALKALPSPIVRAQTETEPADSTQPDTNITNALPASTVPLFERITRVGSDLRLDTLDDGALGSTWVVGTVRPLNLTVNIFAFPGWIAELNSNGSPPLPLELTPAADGRLQVGVPTGDGRLSIYLSDTPLRQLATLISVISVFGVTFFARQAVPTVTYTRTDNEREPLPYRVQALFLLYAVALIALSTGIRAVPSILAATPPVMINTPRFLRGGVDLLGYQAEQSNTILNTISGISKPTVTVTAFWRAARPVSADYQTELVLRAANGAETTISAHRLPGGVPTSAWPTDRYIADRFMLDTATIASGSYRLILRMVACPGVEFLPCADGVPLQSTDPFGTTEDAGIPLGETLIG